VGDRILLSNGLLSFEVEETDGVSLRTRVLIGGELSNRKSMSFPGRVLKQDYMSPQDREDILFGIENDVDFIACSFVSCKEDLLAVRAVLDEKNNTDVVKKATVAHGNHTVDPDSLKYPLRKILAVIKQRAYDALSADDKKPEPKKEQKSKLGTVKFLSDGDLNNTTKK
jgi:hypothetical protein